MPRCPAHSICSRSGIHFPITSSARAPAPVSHVLLHVCGRRMGGEGSRLTVRLRACNRISRRGRLGLASARGRRRTRVRLPRGRAARSCTGHEREPARPVVGGRGGHGTAMWVRGQGKHEEGGEGIENSPSRADPLRPILLMHRRRPCQKKNAPPTDDDERGRPRLKRRATRSVLPGTKAPVR